MIVPSLHTRFCSPPPHTSPPFLLLVPYPYILTFEKKSRTLLTNFYDPPIIFLPLLFLSFSFSIIILLSSHVLASKPVTFHFIPLPFSYTRTHTHIHTAGIPDVLFPDAGRNNIKKTTCTAAAAENDNDNEEDQNCQLDNEEEEGKKKIYVDPCALYYDDHRRYTDDEQHSDANDNDDA